MGKMAQLGGPLATLPPAIARQTDEHGHSPALEPLRRLYSTARWARLRQRVFLRDVFICQCGCKTTIQDPRERIADHKRPHRGDLALFWAEANVQTLWKPHHDGWKQRQERAAAGG